MQIPADLRPYTTVGRDSEAMEHFDIIICRYWKDRIDMRILNFMQLHFMQLVKMSQCWPLSGNNKRVCM